MLYQRDGLLGWATGRLIYHDAIAPGTIRRLLESGPARRQAIFALVADEIAAERHEQVTGTQPDEAAAVRRAEILRDSSARDVLVELLGREPQDGLRGGLERVGLSPLRHPRLYRRLIEVYADPGQHVAAEALRYVGEITWTMLRLLDVLPVELLHPNVLKRLDSISDAHAFVEAVQFVQSVNGRATHEAILDAFNRMRGDAGLDDVLSRFVRRADRILGEPLVADNEVRPLRQVSDMIRTGRLLRNCLSSERKIVGALLGRSAYAVFREQAVLEFTVLSTGGWLYVDAHAPRNGTVPPEIEEAARAKCLVAGVPFLCQGRGGHGRFGRFTDPYDPCFLNIAA